MHYVTYRKKTLIVTDKERSDQFKSEIFKFIPGIKNEEIGVLQESKDGSILRDDNVKIIISVNNTISNGKFPTKEYVDIGFVILDEIDSYISKKRIRIFNYISSRYLMGMSATLTKPNKLGFLINWYIGDVKYKYMKAYNGKNIFVRRIIYNSDNESVYNERGGIDPTNTYKVVMNDIKRETIILKLIAYYYIGKIGIKTFPMIGSKNGKIIIIGLYREQLERLYKRIINELGLTTKEVGIYYGAKTKKERNELKRVVKECKIVLAIRSMAYKGLNIPESDVMIMASSYIPKNKGKNTESLSQLIGRITRKDHIINPILVDIIDNFGFFKKHGKLRYKYYKEKKYLIETEKVNIIGNKS